MKGRKKRFAKMDFECNFDQTDYSNFFVAAFLKNDDDNRISSRELFFVTSPIWERALPPKKLCLLKG